MGRVGASSKTGNLTLWSTQHWLVSDTAASGKLGLILWTDRMQAEARQVSHYLGSPWMAYERDYAFQSSTWILLHCISVSQLNFTAIELFLMMKNKMCGVEGTIARRINYNPGQKCWDTCTFSLKIAPLRFPASPSPSQCCISGLKVHFFGATLTRGRGDVTLRKHDLQSVENRAISEHVSYFQSVPRTFVQDCR